MTNQTFLKHKWFINFTDRTIPNNIFELNQFGENFSLPVKNNKNTIVFQTIKDVENNIKKFDISTKSNISNKICMFLNNIIKDTKPPIKTETKLINASKAVSKFLPNNSDIIFTRADKGNSTFAILKEDYTKNINELLRDNDTYLQIKIYPINTIEENLKTY